MSTRPTYPGEEPVRVETTVYGSPSKQNPNQMDAFQVETTVTLPQGFQGFQQNAQQNRPPVSPRAHASFNQAPEVLSTPPLDTKVTTTVIDPPRQVVQPYAVNNRGPVSGYPQVNPNATPYTQVNAAPLATNVQGQMQQVDPNFVYRFDTFDPNKVPQIEHVPDAYQPVKVNVPVTNNNGIATHAVPANNVYAGAPVYANPPTTQNVAKPAPVFTSNNYQPVVTQQLPQAQYYQPADVYATPQGQGVTYAAPAAYNNNYAA